MDAGVGHQVGLELRQVHVEGAVKTQGGSYGGHDLGNQAVEVGVGGTLHPHVALANVKDGLIVHHEGAVRVLQGGVGGQDGVVGLHHSCGHLGGRVHRELQLGLLPVVHRQTLHQQGRETRAGPPAKAVEDEEALQSGALVRLCRPNTDYSFMKVQSFGGHVLESQHPAAILTILRILSRTESTISLPIV